MKYSLLVIAFLGVIAISVSTVAWRRQRTYWWPGAPPLAMLEQVSPGALDRLAGKRILFAHMSVGDNILAGVADILKDKPNLRLQIQEWDGRTPISDPGLWHVRLGSNGNATAKIRRFPDLLATLHNTPPDIALMKLCYVDIRAATDIESIQATYRDTFKNLRAAYPNTRFVHLTTPLESVSVAFKQRLKRGLAGLLGKPDSVSDNSRREHYNQWLRSTYTEAHSVYDLALVGASGPAGFCCSGRASSVPMLVREYTHDGGHLNEVGRRRVAEQFLVTLARAAESQPGR